MSAGAGSGPVRFAWFVDLGLRTKILAAVGVATVAAVVVGILGIIGVADGATRNDLAYRSNTQGIRYVSAMQADIDQIETDVLGTSLSPDDAESTALLADVDATVAQYAKDESAYTSKPTTPGTPALVADARKNLDSAVQWINTALAPLADANDSTGAWASYKQNGDLEAAIASLGKIIDLENAAAKASAAAASSNASRDRNLELAALALGALLSLGAGLVVSGGVVRSVLRVKHVAEALAEGDLTQRAEVDSRDEIGQMAGSLDAATDRLRGLLATIIESSDALAAASDDLSAGSQQISAGAEETSVQAGVVSSAAEEISRNVGTVAAGAEQMGASIREIAHSANEAASVAAQAVTMVEATNETVGKLGTSSQEIGNVVKVITSIAEQTNLLALNATIEAARAGEAGKGFAVVANEVKELAQETAQATEDIARRVEAIQADTGGAVEAIGQIATIITSINDHQLTIASAVEEQTATTNEMSRNIAEASTGSGEIAENIMGVSRAAESTTQALSKNRSAVDQVAQMGTALRTAVGHFTV